MAAPKQRQDDLIAITPLRTSRAAFVVLGTSPLIVNRVAVKAQRELLMPQGRKTAADRAAHLKHDPLTEFRDSAYISEDPGSPTYLTAPAIWFKNVMKTAALDSPGATKTQIGRLCFVEGEQLPVWGVPQLLMSVTRSMDINRTPDIRSRVIVPHWLTIVPVQWVEPLLNQTSIANLLSTGGITSGAGDWRPQKGAGSYGQFRLAATEDEEEIASRQAAGGYAAQHAAMTNPVCYDRSTRDLLEWHTGEVKRRGAK